MLNKEHSKKHQVKIFCTGGTIDKVYFDALSDYQIGDPVVGNILKEGLAKFSFDVVSILKKDSLEITDEDRDIIYQQVSADSCEHILITHGTDTMINSAQRLEEIKDKTIVLTGAMQPARFRNTDAIFNIGYAISAAQHLPHGIYLAMNGQIFTPNAVQKNRAKAQFETT
ncbi:MAG: asparaginase domain-containing protein [Gammaproteobacteria bacterium]